MKNLVRENHYQMSCRRYAPSVGLRYLIFSDVIGLKLVTTKILPKSFDQKNRRKCIIKVQYLLNKVITDSNGSGQQSFVLCFLLRLQLLIVLLKFYRQYGNNSRLQHNENAPVHKALLFGVSSAKNNTEILTQPPVLLDNLKLEIQKYT